MIDDEEAIRDLGREMLASYGYTVYCAGSGEEGLNRYTHDLRTSFDLVILDLNMPGMGGFKCLQKLREIDATVPVIIASGYTPAEVVKQVLGAGANHVIAKPFELFDLLKTIRRIIDGKQSP